MRILGWLILGLSAVSLTVAVATCRRPSRIRIRLDVVRLAVQIAVPIAMTVVLGTDTPVGLVAGAIVVGSVAGGIQGSTVRVEASPKGPVSIRSWPAVAAWGAGLLIAQGAGLANRSGVVSLGLAISFFSAAMTAGILIARHPRTRTGSPAVVTAAAVSAVLVVAGLGLAIGGLRAVPADAQGVLSCPGSVGGIELDRSALSENPNRLGDFTLMCNYRVDGTGSGSANLFLSWRGADVFTACLSATDLVEDLEPTASGRQGRTWQSGTHRAFLTGTAWPGTLVSFGDVEALVPSLLSSLESVSLRCDHPEPLPEGSLGCPDAVGSLVRAIVSLRQIEARGVTVQRCSYISAYNDAGGSAGDLLIQWATIKIQDGAQTVCGSPPHEFDADSISFSSATRQVTVRSDVNVVAGAAPLERSLFDAAGSQLLSEAEPLALDCPNSGDPAAALPDGIESAGDEVVALGESDVDGDDDSAVEGGDEDFDEVPAEVDPGTDLADDTSDISEGEAVAASLVGLLGALGLTGVSLADWGVSMTDLADAWRRDGSGGVTDLLGVESVDDDGLDRVWDPDAQIARWLTPEEADDFYAGQRQQEIAEHLEAAERDQSDWLDDWMEQADWEQEAERVSREEAAAAWERNERLGDLALGQGRIDLLDRLSRDETFFDSDGNLDVARQQQIADMLRDHLWREQAAPDPEYSETGQLIVDVGHAVDDFSRSIPVRIATGMATGGASEIYHQGRNVVEAVRTSAERSVEWTMDPQTGTWKPPQEDFGVLDGIGVAMDANMRENVPGYGTARALADPNATAGQVAGAVFWDAIGAKMARGQLDEAMDQVRSLGRGVRPPAGVRIHAPDVDLPTIRARAGDTIAPGPYTDRFLPQNRIGDDLSRLGRGEMVPNDLIHQTGWSQPQIDHMNRVARGNGAIIDARTTRVESMHLVRNGQAVPKPLSLKPKTLSIEDYYLGGCELDDIGKVGFYDPSMARPRPIPHDAPADLAAAVGRRSQQRLGEFADYGDRIRNMNGVEVRNGVVIDLDSGLPVAGDIDAVAFRDATTGLPLTGERLARTEAMWRNEAYTNPHTGEITPADASWQQAGPGQHNAEITSADDVIDGMVASRVARLDPTSADYLSQVRQAQHEAYESARNLQQRLLDSSLGSGPDVSLSVDGSGPVRMTDPSWASPQVLGGTTFGRHGATS